MSFIDKRGPELEAAKKVAAAARKFKEAGRMAAGAKALNSEKDQVHGKLDKAATDITDIIEKDIVTATNKIQDCEGLIVLRENRGSIDKFEMALSLIGLIDLATVEESTDTAADAPRFPLGWTLGTLFYQFALTTARFEEFHNQRVA